MICGVEKMPAPMVMPTTMLTPSTRVSVLRRVGWGVVNSRLVVRDSDGVVASLSCHEYTSPSPMAPVACRHHSWGNNSMIEDIRVGARFLAQLPGFLRSPVSLAEARRRVERRLRTRSELLLALLDVIDAGPADAPYARLMSACGCTAQDARQFVLE